MTIAQKFLTQFPLLSKAPSQSGLRELCIDLDQVHRYEIQKGGRVTYRSRNTSNDLRERYKKAEMVTPVTFCQRDPCKTIFQKFFTTFKTAAMGGPPIAGTNTNVAVIPTPNFPGLRESGEAKKTYNDGSKTNPKLRNLITTTDGNVLQQLDPVTLEPIRLFTYGDIDDSLKSSNLAPAHPCVDPDTGEYFTVLLTFGPTALYKVVRIKESAKGPSHAPDLDVLAEIKSPRPTYMHSFALTKRYVVVTHWQCDFAAWGLSVLWYGNAWESFKTHEPNTKASFYVVDRHAGRHVATFECDPYYSFHNVNAFDDGDDVIVDLASYKDHTVIGDYFIDNLRDEANGKPPQQAVLRRFRLRNITKHASATLASGSPPKPVPSEVVFQLDPNINFELPSINPGKFLRNYRYAYGVNRSGQNKTLIYDRIIKVDLSKIKEGSTGGSEHMAAAKFWIEDQCTPSEPVFVPTPGATEEDDGVLLSIVLDGRRRTGFLLILNAQTLEEIARADMPEGKVAPHNFHGMFIPSF
ncbi:MAG: carotenoid oxygenase [Benniella sp.]|nr:MAG: carotenoid oxygenase [Benniella sp.]